MPAAVLEGTVGSVRFRGATSAVSLHLAAPDGTSVVLTVHAADPLPVGARCGCASTRPT